MPRPYPLLMTVAVALVRPAGIPARSAAQETVTHVQRFRWGSVQLHISTNSTHGIELFVRAGEDYLLTWFPPERIAAWTFSVDSLLAAPLTPSAGEGRFTSDALRGRFGSELSIVREIGQKDSAYALRMAGPPLEAPLLLVVGREQVQEVARALEQAVPIAVAASQAVAGGGTMKIYESWQVDEPPQTLSARTGFSKVPEYQVRRLKGSKALATLVVDTLGRVVPGSIEVHDASPQRLIPVYAEVILPDWPFSPGRRDGRNVATRVTKAFSLDASGMVTVQ